MWLKGQAKETNGQNVEQGLVSQFVYNVINHPRIGAIALIVYIYVLIMYEHIQYPTINFVYLL